MLDDNMNKMILDGVKRITLMRKKLTIYTKQRLLAREAAPCIYALTTSNIRTLFWATGSLADSLKFSSFDCDGSHRG